MILRDKTFWNPPRRYDVAERGKVLPTARQGGLRPRDLHRLGERMMAALIRAAAHSLIRRLSCPVASNCQSFTKIISCTRASTRDSVRQADSAQSAALVSSSGQSGG